MRDHRENDVLAHAIFLKVNQSIRSEIEARRPRANDRHNCLFFEASANQFNYGRVRKRQWLALLSFSSRNTEERGADKNYKTKAPRDSRYDRKFDEVQLTVLPRAGPTDYWIAIARHALARNAY